MTHRGFDDALLDLSDDDRLMAEQVAAAYSGLRLEREAPTGRDRRPLIWAGGALAATAAAVMAAGALTVAAPATAWAASPTAATSQDEAAAREVCAGALAGEAGALAAADAPGSLPPLQLLDIRGSGGYAVFADDGWTIQCFLRDTDAGWERGPVVAQPTDQRPGVAAFAVEWAGSTAWSDQDEVFYVGGTVSPATTKVVLELADGSLAEATVTDGRFALWYPDDVEISPQARLVAYDDGTKGEIGALSLPAASGDDGADGKS